MTGSMQHLASRIQRFHTLILLTYQMIPKKVDGENLHNVQCALKLPTHLTNGDTSVVSLQQETAITKSVHQVCKILNSVFLNTTETRHAAIANKTCGSMCTYYARKTPQTLKSLKVYLLKSLKVYLS